MQQAAMKQNDGGVDVKGLTKVIAASSTGTLIEWYDFYVYGSLATILATKFFPASNPTTAFLATLGTMWVGFLVRPFGAVVFGRMGDMVGRKHTFLLTLGIMGVSTFAIGLTPEYKAIGFIAPCIILLLRILQGLAIGGEYGGAATYIAEHSPAHRRGYFTSFLQTTATLGLFVSLLVLLATRTAVTEPVFNDWGWRIPFLLSAVLVVFSYLVRRKMAESPEFAKVKAEGRISANPLVESFANADNRRLVLIALFGVMTGQAVVWYTAQFYAYYFLQKVLFISGSATTMITVGALALGTPFFIYFGSLSDKIGRKKIILAGCLLAAIAFVPIYSGMLRTTQVEVDANAPLIAKRTTDPVTHVVTQESYSTRLEDGSQRTETTKAKDPKVGIVGGGKDEVSTEVAPSLTMSLELGALIWIQVVFAAMAYAPVAAFLVELFPVRLRYTSLSVPYHIGNGVFGGLVPLIGTFLVDKLHNKIAGVYYPIGIALLTFLIGALFIRERATDEGFEETVPEEAPQEVTA
ncbi:MAG TPA: MFS transporter [Fimbriimonas sp.]|nr:MFS transporter [Fimbriimonas sp.]